LSSVSFKLTEHRPPKGRDRKVFPSRRVECLGSQGMFESEARGGDFLGCIFKSQRMRRIPVETSMPEGDRPVLLFHVETSPF
jgi:hypothetical protein